MPTKIKKKKNSNKVVPKIDSDLTLDILAGCIEEMSKIKVDSYPVKQIVLNRWVESLRNVFEQVKGFSKQLE
jgi:hypothetical protein